MVKLSSIESMETKARTKLLRWINAFRAAAPQEEAAEMAEIAETLESLPLLQDDAGNWRIVRGNRLVGCYATEEDARRALARDGGAQ